MKMKLLEKNVLPDGYTETNNRPVVFLKLKDGTIEQVRTTDPRLILIVQDMRSKDILYYFSSSEKGFR